MSGRQDRREDDNDSDLDRLGREIGLSSGDPLWSGDDPARKLTPPPAPEPARAPEGWLPPTDAPPATPEGGWNPPAPEPPRWAQPHEQSGHGGGAPPAAGAPSSSPSPSPSPWPGAAPARVTPVVGQAAEYMPRVGAAVVDFFVRLALVLAGLLVGAIAYSGGDQAGETGMTVGVIIGALAGAAYAPIMMARTNGQTVGHKASHTRVVRRDGSPIGGGGAAVREILVKALLFEGIGGFIVIPTLLNYLWPLWDADREALHDKMCSTRVVPA